MISKYISYNGFFIRNTFANRICVNVFIYQEPHRSDPHMFNNSKFEQTGYSGLMSVKQKPGSHISLKQVLRDHVIYHDMISAYHKKHKCLDEACIRALLGYCRKGITEAFLVFSLYYPKMCNKDIQPYFLRGPKSLYSDLQWFAITHDPVYKDLAVQCYFLSGFNRFGRLALPLKNKLDAGKDIYKCLSEFNLEPVEPNPHITEQFHHYSFELNHILPYVDFTIKDSELI